MSNTSSESPKSGKKPILTAGGDNPAGFWLNDRKTNEKAPDITGNVTLNGQEYNASGWLRPGGKKGDKEYLPFVSLTLSKRIDGNNFEPAGEGSLQGINTVKGNPVDPAKRSFAFGTVTLTDGSKATFTVYATETLEASPGMGQSLGFTGKVNGKKAEPASQNSQAGGQQSNHSAENTSQQARPGRRRAAA